MHSDWFDQWLCEVKAMLLVKAFCNQASEPVLVYGPIRVLFDSEYPLASDGNPVWG